MTFFSFFWKVGKNYPLPIFSIALLMALIGVGEGIIVALVIPLLGLAFNNASVLPQQGILSFVVQGIGHTLALLYLTPSLGVMLVMIGGDICCAGVA